MRSNLSKPILHLLLFAFAFCLLVASPFHVTAQQQSQRQDRDSAESFVNSVAKLIYNTAWPTATYRDVSINSIHLAPGGFDVAIKLNGISAFDNDSLWLELVLQVRNGSFYDMKLGRNNAVLMQPFATVAAFASVTATLAQQYAAQHPQPAAQGAPPTANSQPMAQAPPSGDLAGAVCLGNQTSTDITLQYHWGEAAWQPMTIAANARMKLWWPYADSSRSSPNLVVRYNDPIDPSAVHTFSLPRNQTKLPFECSGAANYNFELNANRTAVLVTHP